MSADKLTVSFKSVYFGQADYMVYHRATHTSQRVRVDNATGEFVQCSGHIATEAERDAVAEFIAKQNA